MNNTLVSVCCITYNHEKYIRDTIEGFLMQKTNFDFEIIIGEDFSTDETAKIVMEYANKYPDIIKAECNAHNIGTMPNFFKTIQKATGKYIALCEGDDYWTDPLKLQSQVDFLEKNKDYVITAHKHDTLKNEVIYKLDKNLNESLTLQDLAFDIPFNTLTVMFKRSALDINEYINLKINYAHFLFLYLAQFGKVHYNNTSMAVYRVHTGGIWSGKTFYDRAMMGISTLGEIIEYFSKNKIVAKRLKHKYIKSCLINFFIALKTLNVKQSLSFFKKSFKYGFRVSHLSVVYYFIINKV